MGDGLECWGKRQAIDLYCLFQVYAQTFYLYFVMRGEWPSGIYSHRKVNEVKLGQVRSNSRWVTSEA